MDELSANRFNKATKPQELNARDPLNACLKEYTNNDEYELTHVIVLAHVRHKETGEPYTRFFQGGELTFVGQAGLLETCKLDILKDD